jgi:hypothetical protein
MNAATPAAQLSPPAITSVEALVVARADARRVYRDIDQLYRIDLCLMPDGWHVDFEFKDPAANSGGPHYVIDADSGHIRSKRYEQ